MYVIIPTELGQVAEAGAYDSEISAVHIEADESTRRDRAAGPSEIGGADVTWVEDITNAFVYPGITLRDNTNKQ